MLNGNKALIQNECERRNAVRRVYIGKVNHMQFFEKIRGDLLIAGYGVRNHRMLADLIYTYMNRKDMPTIVLSGNLSLLRTLQENQIVRNDTNTVTFCPENRCYHPFYGMSAQQMLRFIRLTAEELGYGMLIDHVLVYSAAVLNVVSASYPVSLPALTKLLQHDDDFISSLAIQSGFSNVIADNIRANPEAGIVLRRVCERLENIFEDVYTSGSDTQFNFQTGAQEHTGVMAFYAVASNQSLMNSYLKEELFFTLRRTSRVRIVADELLFVDENDELLKYLFQMKRQGKIELILISTNVKESVYGMRLNFANLIMFQHDDATATEDLSKDLFGVYQFHFPVPVAGKPPAVFFTLKTSVHWQITAEEHLRVRAEDLFSRQGVFSQTSDYVAVKTTANDNVYLIETAVFLPKETEHLIAERRTY